jgi:hypothetical protein
VKAQEHYQVQMPFAHLLAAFVDRHLNEAAEAEFAAAGVARTAIMGLY